MTRAAAVLLAAIAVAALGCGNKSSSTKQQPGSGNQSATAGEQPGGASGETRPANGQPGAPAAQAAAEIAIEYRSISNFPTCLGNERIKIDGGGNVFAAKNDTECDKGEAWSTPYPAKPVRTLNGEERAGLAALVQQNGLLSLPPLSSNPAAADGRREEIEVTIDGTTTTIVVENVDKAEFTRVRSALFGYARP